MAFLKQQKAKYEEIADTLNNMIKSNLCVNEFQLKSITLEVVKIKKNNHVMGYAFLGMISCIKQEIEEMHYNHKNAIKLERSYETIALYAVSLLNSNLNKEAYDKALEAYKLCGEDIYNILHILDILIQCCFYLNYEEELNNYLQEWKNIKKEDHTLPFLEDNSDNLKCLFNLFDINIEENSENIVSIDPDMFALADELVDGVELYED